MCLSSAWQPTEADADSIRGDGEDAEGDGAVGVLHSGALGAGRVLGKQVLEGGLATRATTPTATPTDSSSACSTSSSSSSTTSSSSSSSATSSSSSSSASASASTSSFAEHLQQKLLSPGSGLRTVTVS